MKKMIPFILFIFVLFFAQSVSAQVINVPSKSQKHFGEKYPDAKNVEWSNNVAYYIAKFTVNDEKYRARYHINGNWDFTEKESELTKFPADVQSSLTKSRFSDWKVESAATVENKKKEHLYRIEVSKGIEKKYIFFDEHGKEIKSNMTI
jgi:hypothetical protein